MIDEIIIANVDLLANVIGYGVVFDLHHAEVLAGGGDTVDASTAGLYVASRRYDARLETANVPSFPTRVEGDDIYVEL